MTYAARALVTFSTQALRASTCREKVASAHRIQGLFFSYIVNYCVGIPRALSICQN